MSTTLIQEGVRVYSSESLKVDPHCSDLVPDCGQSHESALAGIVAQHQQVDETVSTDFSGIDISDTEQRSQELMKHLEVAKYGRSRNRFAVPVIMCDAKYIARSSTVPLAKEVIYRMGIDVLDSVIKSLTNFTLPEFSLLKDNFGLAIELLVCLPNSCSSSEKAEGETEYSDFALNSVPYPGCEFFSNFRETQWKAEYLRFDWRAEEVNAELSVNEAVHPSSSDQNYKVNGDSESWDLCKLTKRYLQYMLTYITGDTAKGMLVHCISGWDRTPLFVSLMRVSLWADGVIHRSLDAAQMLYFTLAYDWMFFSHQLENRVQKAEDIMLFCFYFLKFVKGENYNTRSRQVF
ncbi:hypothetical protein HAZT_HAZT002876 [Hyalella azteca]|uniref:Myotubularin phosphatase domain-containing protein n=1 Tax=Hyalella azteca TaxID=294128 RepID=A0A6A0GSB3_HYAAZ|nr:hypothetical protein HAZT_HAZT002876 [Hyalella azteca]